MRTAWLHILGWEEPDHHASVSDPEFEARLNQVFDEIDIGGDGFLDPQEVAAFLEKTHTVSAALANFLINSFDTNSDGMIDRNDLHAVAH